MKAWVIKWSWIGDHAAVEQPVITVLSARTPADEVRRFVERYYTTQTGSISEMLDMARYSKPAKPAYPAEFTKISGIKWEDQIVCGYNPFIEAFKASDISYDETSGRLSWNDEELRERRERVERMVRLIQDR